ncbi:predicted protein [Arabidopsis lyrata subsp. lyrata]|uniref:Predicted protein n=1 Tax=Arabidopsis lyrata subsp. lyrata TaxID=81972 RepID=D7ML17_ARALL|nr:predicted protein [Arabidopsis lyrata subsp. lyrata]
MLSPVIKFLDDTINLMEENVSPIPNEMGFDNIVILAGTNQHLLGQVSQISLNLFFQDPLPCQYIHPIICRCCWRSKKRFKDLI